MLLTVKVRLLPNSEQKQQLLATMENLGSLANRVGRGVTVSNTL
jgi:hypothetical protein